MISFSQFHTQATICKPVHISGHGLHTGQAVEVTLLPADIDTNIVFLRTDLTPSVRIPALWEHTFRCERSTQLKSKEGLTVETTEHLLSALYGLGITNCVIELNASELPICDGSALPFVQKIEDVGVEKQNKRLNFIKIIEPISVDGSNGSRASLEPANTSSWQYDLDYEAMGLPAQTAYFDENTDIYKDKVAPCRTFGFQAEIDELIEKGLIKGAYLDCAVLFDRNRVVNSGGLRDPLEPALHKLLDAIGDLSLLGSRLIARYHGIKSGHALNAALAKAVMATPSCYQISER